MRSRPFILLLLLGVVLAFAGCDTSLDAFEEGAGTFSVFGTLDGNIDRQFVRIEPLKDSVFAGTQGPLKARVTSENVATGERVEWQVGSFPVQGVSVRNAFTVADLVPGATYRFTVEPTGEANGREPATAEVTLPQSFPPLEVRDPPDFSDMGEPTNMETTVIIRGVERLGTVRADYDAEVCDRNGCVRVQPTSYHLDDVTRVNEDAVRVSIAWEEEILAEQAGAFLSQLFSFRIRVASISEDWPEYAEDNPPGNGPEGEPLPPLGVNTNIEGGTGFLGGTFTRVVDVPILR